MSTRYDFSMRAGNSGSTDNENGLEVLIKRQAVSGLEAENLSGSDFVFIARASSDSPVTLRFTSAERIQVLALEGRVVVPFSVADSRLLHSAGAPAGQGRVRMIYELERRYEGAQRAILFGQITIEPGINDDD
jgi:hypothetical protein